MHSKRPSRFLLGRMGWWGLNVFEFRCSHHVLIFVFIRFEWFLMTFQVSSPLVLQSISNRVIFCFIYFAHISTLENFIGRPKDKLFWKGFILGWFLMHLFIYLFWFGVNQRGLSHTHKNTLNASPQLIAIMDNRHNIGISFQVW